MTRAVPSRNRERLLRTARRLAPPVCRMRTVDDLILDVMPLDEQVLGFTNRWYDLALRTAHPIVLGSDCTIAGIAAPVFLATKWEAFGARGVDDPITSHDLEDIITLVAGRVELLKEVAAMDGAARRFIAEATKGFLGTGGADDVVSGCLPDAPLIPGYVDLVMERLRSLSGS